MDTFGRKVLQGGRSCQRVGYNHVVGRGVSPMRGLERVWQEEAKENAREEREGAHDNEQPEPARPTTDTTHVENTIGEQL